VSRLTRARTVRGGRLEAVPTSPVATGCVRCGYCATADPADTLIAVIAAYSQPNRPATRQPRTKAQRRTARGGGASLTWSTLFRSDLSIAAWRPL